MRLEWLIMSGEICWGNWDVVESTVNFSNSMLKYKQLNLNVVKFNRMFINNRVDNASFARTLLLFSFVFLPFDIFSLL